MKELRSAALAAVNASHRGQYQEATELLSLALAKLEEQECIERKLNEVGFAFPVRTASKDDPRGREYGWFTASPRINTVKVTHKTDSAVYEWTATFPTFADFSEWAKDNS